jgi:hypothetical protein
MLELMGLHYKRNHCIMTGRYLALARNNSLKLGKCSLHCCSGLCLSCLLNLMTHSR